MPNLTPSERIGTTVGGRYEVRRLLGEGGFSAVFEAVHTFTGRDVALKILHGHLTTTEQITERFLMEARAMARIKHDGIVQVLDAGRDPDGSVFIALELLDGESLESTLQRVGKLTWGEAASICVDVLGALGEAHRHKIIHRDIKPGNIFIVRKGDGSSQAKLLDFGIAHVAQGKNKLTAAGMILGTPEYMSPEQGRTANVGPESDLWSVGIVMWECLTGHTPFVSETATEILLKIATTDAPPIADEVPEIPAQVAAVIDRSLVRDIEQRYRSADEMREAMLRAMRKADETASARSSLRTPTPFRGVRRGEDGIAPAALGEPPRKPTSISSSQTAAVRASSGSNLGDPPRRPASISSPGVALVPVATPGVPVARPGAMPPIVEVPVTPSARSIDRRVSDPPAPSRNGPAVAAVSESSPSLRPPFRSGVLPAGTSEPDDLRSSDAPSPLREASPSPLRDAPAGSAREAPASALRESLRDPPASMKDPLARRSPAPSPTSDERFPSLRAPPMTPPEGAAAPAPAPASPAKTPTKTTPDRASAPRLSDPGPRPPGLVFEDRESRTFPGRTATFQKPPEGRRVPPAWIAMGVGALCLVGAGVYFAVQGPAPADDPEAPNHPPRPAATPDAAPPPPPDAAEPPRAVQDLALASTNDVGLPQGVAGADNAAEFARHAAASSHAGTTQRMLATCIPSRDGAATLYVHPMTPGALRGSSRAQVACGGYDLGVLPDVTSDGSDDVVAVGARGDALVVLDSRTLQVHRTITSEGARGIAVGTQIRVEGEAAVVVFAEPEGPAAPTEVRAVSAVSSRVLWRVRGSGRLARVGQPVELGLAVGPDASGDNVGDVAVGLGPVIDSNAAPGQDRRCVQLFSGSNGQPLWPQPFCQTHTRSAQSVSLGPDVNGDGRADVVLGSDRPAPGEAPVVLLSGLDGRVLRQWSAPSGDLAGAFGWPVALSGDLNGNGTPDVAVGSIGQHTAVTVFDTSTGQPVGRLDLGGVGPGNLRVFPVPTLVPGQPWSLVVANPADGLHVYARQSPQEPL